MMNVFKATIHVKAPAQHVWQVIADVPRWPEWTSTVTSVESLGATSLAMGARYRIVQPRLRPAVWTVVELDPNRSFSWEMRAPGLRALGGHALTPALDGTTRVDLQLRFSGPMAPIVSALAGRLTAEYVSVEAASLKRRCETGA